MSRDLNMTSFHYKTDDEYFDLPHYNRSVIWDAYKRTPAHSKIGITSTAAMDFGTAVHRMILQPEVFQKSYGVLDEDWVRESKKPKATKKWKEAQAKLEKDGVTLLTQKEYDQYSACLTSAYDHPFASNLLSDSSADREVVTTWTDDFTELDLKCKYDLISTVGGYVADVKTTKDASPEGFARSAANFGYPFPAAFYLQTCPDYDYYIIAIETSPPYPTAVYTFPKEVMSHARVQLSEALDRFSSCVSSDIWHGYSDAAEELEMPGWWS